jgi:DNA-binding transcriptional ArsR family regulator
MADKKRRKRRRNKNHALIVGLQHPLRREILRRMSDGEKASPSELAEEMGEPLSSVAYHVRVLVRSGALKADGERQVRGARQHFYRRSVEEDWVEAILEEDEEQSP